MPAAERRRWTWLAMHVFVDTNILLNFFHFSGEDLDALSNVFASQEKGAASVHLTDQTVAEFRRNREAKILDALKRFNEFRRGLQLPHFMRAYEEFSKAEEIAGELQTKLGALEKRAEADIAESKLQADELIHGIFSSASILETTEAIYRKARMRVDLGNPPGKQGSLGDAVNWELLLETVPTGQDLHLITEDKDFYSSMHTEMANPFLDAEWREKKSSNLRVYRTLSKFMCEHFDGITLSFDTEKQGLIAALGESGSFAKTHSIVESLSAYGYFSFHEATAMLDAALENSQVRLILSDNDLDALFRKAVIPHKKKFTKEAHISLVEKILASRNKVEEETDDDDLPF